MRTRIAILICAAGIAVSLAGGGAPAAVNSDPDLPAVEKTEPPRSGNPLWAVPLAALHETRERPIFTASRRPPAPPVVAAAVEAPPPSPRAAPPRPERPALVLLGTVSGEALHFGIFHNPATTKTLRLAVGENFEGWTLRAVSQHRRALRLRRPDRDPGAAPRREARDEGRAGGGCRCAGDADAAEEAALNSLHRSLGLVAPKRTWREGGEQTHLRIPAA